MTAFAPCRRCHESPQVIRHVGGMVSVIHVGGGCHVVIPTYPEAEAARRWQAHVAPGPDGAQRSRSGPPEGGGGSAAGVDAPEPTGGPVAGPRAAD